MKKYQSTRFSTYILLAIFAFPLALGGYVYVVTDFTPQVEESVTHIETSRVVPPINFTATELVRPESFTTTTPWQEIYRDRVGQLSGGGILEGAEKFQRIVHTHGLPRDNH